MRLRRTTAADPGFLAACAALDADLRATYGALQASYAPLNAVAELATVVVAEAGDEVVGAGCFRAYDATAVELKRVFVPAARRGQGIGRAIVAALEAWARELGFATALLETGTLQAAAIALYRRCGYAACPLFPPYVGMPASVCMRKSLLDS